MVRPGLYEKLAAIEHERWSAWQRYVHSLGERREDGSLVLPTEHVARWERQIETDYADLSEAEKDSDREQVDRYWPLVSSDDGETMTAPTVERDATSDDQSEHTGGMVALVPTAEDAAKLAVEGGHSVDELHLTLAYLGDDVTDWDDEIVAAVHEVARKLTDPAEGDDSDRLAVPSLGGRGPGQRGPLTLHIFAHSRFNPNGGPDDQEPCMVYQFSGEGNLNRVESLHGEVCMEVKDAIGEVNFPEQHERYVPHLTAGYNLPPDVLSYTGPVTFDRLRVALGDTVTDYPLGGEAVDEVTAAVKAAKRERARKNNDTLPGTDKYPIENCSDAQNAINRVGTTTEAGDDVRRHIIKQIKKHDCSQDMIPDHWKADGSLKASAESDSDGTIRVMTADGTFHDLDSLVAVGPKGYKHGWIRVGPDTAGSSGTVSEKIISSGLDLGQSNADGSRPIRVISNQRRRRTSGTGTSVRSPSADTVATLGPDDKVYVGYNSNDRRVVPDESLNEFLGRARNEGSSGPGWKAREVLKEITGESNGKDKTPEGGEVTLAQPKVMKELIQSGDSPGAKVFREGGKDVLRVTDPKRFVEWLDMKSAEKLPRGAPTARKSQQRAAGELARQVRSEFELTASAELDSGQREALTAAVGAMVQQLGPVGAHGLAPQVFQTPESLEFVDSLIELPDADEGLTAAATTELPSIDLFTPPANLPPGTGHYVDHEPLPNGLRRVYGRLAEWDIPHIGIDGQKIYPPRSPSGYRWFHTKSAWVQGPNGPERIKVGHLTFGTGHAPMGVNHLAAAAHYDNSGHRGAKIRMSEDEHGPVYAGVTVAGLEGARLEEFGESDVSGDWRRPIGPLDLVATLCVNVGGYPKVGLSLAASGEPLALVASAKAWGNPAAVVDVEAIAAAVVTEMGRRAELNGKRDALLAALDDSTERYAELLDELDDDFGPDELEFINELPEPNEADLTEVGLTAAVGRRGKNWIERTGTGHLPRYIKRISKHLRRKGMTESHAIAVAVNAAKKMCASGDVNFPGRQNVNAGSRAEACKAVAEWEAKKSQAKAT